ncbi:hypothetical protein STEG23_022626 [Scotinomys teguina]
MPGDWGSRCPGPDARHGASCLPPPEQASVLERTNVSGMFTEPAHLLHFMRKKRLRMRSYTAVGHRDKCGPRLDSRTRGGGRFAFQPGWRRLQN